MPDSRSRRTMPARNAPATKGQRPAPSAASAKGTAIYHVVYEHESFDDAAEMIFQAVLQASTTMPRKPRHLYLDIDGHRNSKGGLDPDMYELVSQFLPNQIGPFITEMHTPLGHFRNGKPQRDDMPPRLIIQASSDS